MTKTACLYIFTRDLRVQDNRALTYALQNWDQVYPVFILDSRQVDISVNHFHSQSSVDFMLYGLRLLNSSLSNKLTIIYTNRYTKIINDLLDKIDTDDVVISKDYTPFARQRIKDIVQATNENSIYEIDNHMVSSSYEKAYAKFTPYMKWTKSKGILKTCKTPSSSMMKKIAKVNVPGSVKMSELNKYGDIRLKFDSPDMVLKRASKLDNKAYLGKRDRLSLDTTMMSPYLKFGLLGPRQVYWSVSTEIKRQLIWRDFYMQVIIHKPGMIKEHNNSNTNNFKPKNKAYMSKYDKLSWPGSTKHFEYWCNGETGFPIVDACMKQLIETGFMHNRGRMIVSSFLVKILHIDWRLGEQFFAKHLRDYDIYNNNGGWQWSAGTGTDAMPYFRIFNPWLQSKKHDPDCEYIRHWLPEFKDVDVKHIHKWYDYWDSYEIGFEPCVDYAMERDVALKLYKRVK
jgi:deoxyribodipyrimidine photo-lyase